MAKQHVPESCKGCHFVTKEHERKGEFAKCKHPSNHGYYLSTLHRLDLNDFQGTKKPCPYSVRIIYIYNNLLWIRMYRKGIEKEQIPIADKEKALVRANWLLMKIAYTADWFIKRYDKRMEQQRIAYNIRQVVNNYISIE